MKMLQKIITIFGNFIGKALNLYYCYRLYNYIFERSPFKIVKFFVQFIPLPNKDFVWKVKLINNKVVSTQIIKEQKLTAEFALSYKWHSPELNFTEALLVKHTTAEYEWIDIGANLGLRSLLALSENRRVTFFEPNNATNLINQQRCLLNRFSNYVFFETGISDKSGNVIFQIDNTSYKSTIENNILSDSEIERYETIKIDTLDNFASKENWKKANIKIDVEGHEINVLRGAEQFIKSVKPNIIVEVNEKGEHFSLFLSWAQKFNYTVFEIGTSRRGKHFRMLKADEDPCKIISNDFLMSNDERMIEVIKKYQI